MTVLSEEAVLKRLRALDQTQESIETTSLWIVHHYKDSCAAEKLLNGWIDVFRIGSEKQRLALFYLSNDVCQKTKKKPKFQSFRSAFVPKLVTAMSLIRNEETLKQKVSRIVDIWDEREIFEKQSLKEMRQALEATYAENSETEDSLLLDFDPGILIHDLEKFQKIESAIEKARIILSKGNFDFQTQMRDRMKDRDEGKKFLKEVDETCKKMGDFVTALECQLGQHHRLIELLEHARGFFGQQLRDATVVEDAYKKFGDGIQGVKDQLEEMEKTGAYLGASPPQDAPSPSADDDPFACGLEEAIKDFKKPGARDLIESADMEVDEEMESAAAVTVNAGGMNLQANQSFMDGPMQQQMLSMMGQQQQPKVVDPRIERMQKAAKRRIEEVNARLASENGNAAVDKFQRPEVDLSTASCSERNNYQIAHAAAPSILSPNVHQRAPLMASPMRAPPPPCWMTRPPPSPVTGALGSGGSGAGSYRPPHGIPMNFTVPPPGLPQRQPTNPASFGPNVPNLTMINPS